MSDTELGSEHMCLFLAGLESWTVGVCDWSVLELGDSEWILVAIFG